MKPSWLVHSCHSFGGPHRVEFASLNEKKMITFYLPHLEEAPEDYFIHYMHLKELLLVWPFSTFLSASFLPFQMPGCREREREI